MVTTPEDSFTLTAQSAALKVSTVKPVLSKRHKGILQNCLLKTDACLLEVKFGTENFWEIVSSLPMFSSAVGGFKTWQHMTVLLFSIDFVSFFNLLCFHLFLFCIHNRMRLEGKCLKDCMSLKQIIRNKIVTFPHPHHSMEKEMETHYGNFSVLTG